MDSSGVGFVRMSGQESAWQATGLDRTAWNRAKVLIRNSNAVTQCRTHYTDQIILNSYREDIVNQRQNILKIHKIV